MIYENRSRESALGQGDIIEDCALIFWTIENQPDGPAHWQSATSKERVILLTQACDLANTKTTKVQVAVVHETSRLVSEGILKPQTIRDQVRRHLVFGWYFLPAGDGNPESLVDLHDRQSSFTWCNKFVNLSLLSLRAASRTPCSPRDLC